MNVHTYIATYIKAFQAHLQDDAFIILTGIKHMAKQYILVKVGIKSCRCARECFISSHMHLATAIHGWANKCQCMHASLLWCMTVSYQYINYITISNWLATYFLALLQSLFLYYNI